MTRRRFYAPPSAFEAEGARVALSEDESRHLRDVLRLREGDEAYVFDGEGREFACVVAEAGGRRGAARLEVRARAEPPSPESALELTLAVALLKGEKFDLVVQKATELGATRVVPILTRRADVRPGDARDASKRVERWRRLALEAAKQSGRARFPEVPAPVAFAELVGRGGAGAEAGADEDKRAGAEAGAGAARVLFAERGGHALDSLASAAGSRPRSVVALVGPEGGWEEEEVALAREEGWAVVTLGGRTLRAETAAVAVCVLLQHLFGDLA